MHIYPPLVHPHRTPMRSDHEACRPRLRSEEEPQGRCLASGWDLRLFPSVGHNASILVRVAGDLQACARADGICAWMRAAGRGYNTAQARSRASVVPSPTPILLSAHVAERLSARGGHTPLETINPAARRKASSVHVHVTAARPQPADPFPLTPRIEECPYFV